MARLLSVAGYLTSPGGNRLYFEDQSLLGFAAVFDSVNSMLVGWETAERDFLVQNASQLREAKTKAWNVYTVLLTEDDADGDELDQLLKIEMNLVSTRKLVGCGVRDVRELRYVLGPLLPIRTVPADSGWPVIEGSLGSEAERLFALLKENDDPTQTIRLLLEDEDRSTND